LLARSAALSGGAAGCYIRELGRFFKLSPLFRRERTMKPHLWIACGAVLAALSVVTGAFGAHGLRPALEKNAELSAEQVARRLETYETAARYHMYHAIAIVLAGLLASHFASRWLNVAGACFTLGILIFSGFCYALALGGPKFLGAIVPIGGVAFILGWLAMAVAAASKG
jgi:uncharacterized membrane protein YgdD (TMEM256/DUF423 family)